MTVIRITALQPDTRVVFPCSGGEWDERLRTINSTLVEGSTAELERFVPGLSDVISGEVESVTRLSTTATPRYGIEDFLRDVSLLDVTDNLRVYFKGELIDIEPFLQRRHILHRPGVVNGYRMLSALEDGYTFNVGTVDRRNRELNDLCEHLERVIGGPAEVYSFLAGGFHAASPLHFDQPELLVVPVLGNKHWEVRESPFRAALGPQFVGLPDAPIAFGGTVTPGDAIVVPRGWLHRAAPTGDPSICLTFGLFRTFGARLATRAADRAVEKELLRRPLRTADGWPLRPASITETLEPAALEVVNVDALAAAAAMDLASLPNRNLGRPPWSLTRRRIPGSTLLRSRAPGGFFRVPTASADTVAFAACDRVVEVSTDVIDAVSDLLTADRDTLDALIAASSQPSAVAEVGSVLVAHGLLEADTHPPGDDRDGDPTM